MNGPIIQTIQPVTHDLGQFQVRRAIPSRERTMVGPFIFVDEFGPATLAIGAGMDVRPHPHINLATVTWLFEGAIEHRDDHHERRIEEREHRDHDHLRAEEREHRDREHLKAEEREHRDGDHVKAEKDVKVQKDGAGASVEVDKTKKVEKN